MKIENQVCSMEQAKKFKEFGIVQDKSIYTWTVYCPDPTGEKYYYIVMDENHPDAEHAEVLATAFTVSELGAMIGKGTKAAELHWQWLLDCVNSGLSGTVAYNVAALAGHVITQLENGTLIAAEVNERLK